jgi:hypothetical protein
LNTQWREKIRLDRRRFIGGSDARVIMSTDETALIRLWREKRGEAEPEDLSGNLIVQLGVATEPLNRTWYERNAGRPVTDVQRWVRHPVHRYSARPSTGSSTISTPYSRPSSICRGRSRRGGRRKHMAPLAQHGVTNACRRRSGSPGWGKWIEMTMPADAPHQHFCDAAERGSGAKSKRERPRPYGIEPPRPRVEAVRLSI